VECTELLGALVSGLSMPRAVPGLTWLGPGLTWLGPGLAPLGWLPQPATGAADGGTPGQTASWRRCLRCT